MGSRNLGLVVGGVVVALLAGGLLLVGLDGLVGLVHDFRHPVPCSTKGNPDCIPLEVEGDYRALALFAGLLLFLGGLAIGRGLARPTVDDSE